MCLPQPTYFTISAEIWMFDSYESINVRHNLNNMLVLLSMYRVYIPFRSLISMSSYANPRAARLCKYNRIEHNMLYCIKCILQEHPLRAITSVFLVQELVLGYCLRVSEGFLTRDNPNLTDARFNSYINCFWCIFITMTTVGYGDYFPKTVPGRIVTFKAAFSGVIISSLLIVSLSAYLTMQAHELKSHLTLLRIRNQE